MIQDTVKLQFKVPRSLSVALRSAALNDRRTQQDFLIILLQGCPAIKLCVPKNVKDIVEEGENEGEASLTVPAYTDAERGAAAAAWRPGQ